MGKSDPMTWQKNWLWNNKDCLFNRENRQIFGKSFKERVEIADTATSVYNELLNF